eukprot:461551-Prymnesium_polylepis.1
MRFVHVLSCRRRGARLAVLLHHEPPEDLAAARLGDRVGDDGATAQLLERGHALVDKLHHLVRRDGLTRLGHD